MIASIDRGIAKPDRDAFDRICGFYKEKGIALNPQDCLMIGDSPTDREFAENAGIDSVFVRWGFHEEKLLTCKPRYAVATPEELYELLL